MQKTVTDVQASLAPIAQGLGADGYELEVLKASEDALELRVVALENACGECLVPPDAMAQVISVSLKQLYGPGDIRIEYPAASPAH
jgi:hypothetical protein